MLLDLAASDLSSEKLLASVQKSGSLSRVKNGLLLRWSQSHFREALPNSVSPEFKANLRRSGVRDNLSS